MSRRFSRRQFARLLAAAAGTAAIGPLLHRAMAMAPRPEFQGVHKLKGDVRVNDKPAAIGTVIRPGDTITTGADGEVLFVVGEDAYLLRANSRLQVAGAEGLLQQLKLQAGRLLSVFAPNKGARRFETTTVAVGVRGTAVYLESEPERTYICTCYGATELVAVADPQVRESINTRHHDEPRYVSRGADGRPVIEKAKVINHTDDELIMLEWIVGRVPPFDTTQTRY